MELVFSDKMSLNDSSVRITSDGYLVTSARVARTGIQVYDASEFPGVKEFAGKDKIRVYRDPNAVFSDEALRGYAHRPITLDHPNEMVSAENWRDFAIGQTGGEVVRDGEFVRVPMVLMDKEAIGKVMEGVRELSMGYTGDIEIRDGVTPDGQKYDAVVSNMKMNHLAVVTKARGGSGLKIGDKERKEVMSEPAMKIRTIMVDGLQVSATEESAIAIDKLQKVIIDSAKAHGDEVKALKDALAKTEAERDGLKSKVLTDADIEKKVSERAEILGQAKLVDKDFDANGKSPAEIRRAIVTAVMGDSAKEKSDEYISYRFDDLVENAKKGDTDGVRSAFIDGVKPKQPTDAWGNNVFATAGVAVRK